MDNKNQITIAIVDDSEDILRTNEFLLKKEGFKTITYNSGKAFLADDKNKTVDLVLLDVLMPEINGYETCRRYKANPKTRFVPVIFTSALGDVSDKRKAFELEAADYLTKPINKLELLARINNHLKIRDLQKELEKINFSLEEKVLIRTRELESLNKKLKQSEKDLKKQNKDYEHLTQKLSVTIQELEIAKEKAEESDRLKTAFLANMSHEVRTPLNGIMGFSEMLALNFIDQDKTEKYARIIMESSNQLLVLVNDIIDISKIESNQLEVFKEPVKVGEIIGLLEEQFKDKAEKENIEFITKIKIDPRTNILTDLKRIVQVLSNLIINAIKFTNEGSLTLGVFGYNHSVVFFVEDTGIGIKTEVADRIFERFRQEEVELTRISSGTGLGLSISKGLVELLDGKIWYESEIDKGSVFYVSLPVNG